MRLPGWFQRWREYRRADYEAFRELAREAPFGSMKRSPRLYRGLFYGWDYPLTTAGKFFLWAGFISGVIGGVYQYVPLYQVPVALGTFILLTLTVSYLFSWGRVRVSGHFPEKVSAGQLVRGHFHVVREGLLPAYDVIAGCFLLTRSWEREADMPMLPALPRGKPVTLTISLRPLRRGLHQLPPLRICTTFPWNLLRFELTRLRLGTMLVLPRFHPVTSIEIDVGARYQPGGIALTSHVGESPEYIGNRDYLPGDSLRRIDFRSWGRLARPVVKEYQEEYYCRIALVLDTFITPGRRPKREGFPELEAAVSLAASVADALAHGEYIIDIFAAGPELHVFRAGRHTAHFENVLDILACVDACRQNPFTKVTPALVNELANISTLVCVLLDWDDDRRALVHAALDAGCRVKVLIVRDAPTTSPIDAGQFSVFTSAQVHAGGYTAL